jgi:hypothetical protein
MIGWIWLSNEMAMYVLDTDHLSLMQRDGLPGQRIRARLSLSNGSQNRCVGGASPWRIALTQDATILTRNQKDFGQILNLKIEDWSL